MNTSIRTNSIFLLLSFFFRARQWLAWLLAVLAPMAAVEAQSTYAPLCTFSSFVGLAGVPGMTDGSGSAARFLWPHGLAADSTGNIYVADTYSHTIRKITPSGVVTTLAGKAGVYGSDDGTGSFALFRFPEAVAVDNSDNVYVADKFNATIRKVTPGGATTTLAGGPGVEESRDGIGLAARFFYPQRVAVDNLGNVYVVEANAVVRKITPARVVTTLSFKIGTDGGIAVDSAGNLYGSSGVTIIKVTPAGAITTLAGMLNQSGIVDGTGSAARFYDPSGIAIDGNGNLYVTEKIGSVLRMITPAGIVTTLAGAAGVIGSQNGVSSQVRFSGPQGLAVDPSSGLIYVADTDNFTIRKGELSDTAPVIAIQPASQIVPVSNAATFTVIASGKPTPTFQWQKDGVNISGATSNSYTIASVTAGDLGNYRVTARIPSALL